jgi:FecR protein
MKKTFVLAALICLTFSLGLFAQTTTTSISDMYLISSKAGRVNLVEGAVLVERNNGKNTGLNKSDEIKIGEKVSTGSNGKAEILLNPGSYARLGENSEFEFATTELDNLQLKLNRGSAIFEIITHSDEGFILGIQTPQTKTFVLESGVYRIDVLADNSTKVSVTKGKIQIGDNLAQIIKAGKSAIVKDSQVAVVKFDRDNKDALDTWSKIRAKDLMAVNARLRNANLTNSLVSSFYDRGWNAYNTFGVWVFNRFSGTWCYLPFGGYGSRNPYGWGYDWDIWRCNIPPRIIYTPPVITTVDPPKNTYAGNKRDRMQTETTDRTAGGGESTRTRPVFEGSRGGKEDNGWSPPIFNSSGTGRGSSTIDSSGKSDTPRYEPPRSEPPTRSEPPVSSPPTTRGDSPATTKPIDN